MNDLPLLELFVQLREAGLPLGVDEYNLLLRALQAGFGLADRDALARLCCNLWVKSDEQQRLFDYHFAEVWKNLPGDSSTSSESSLISKESEAEFTPESQTEVEEVEEKLPDTFSPIGDESNSSSVIDIFAEIWEQAQLEGELPEKNFGNIDLQKLLSEELEEDLTDDATSTNLSLDSSATLTLEVEDELQVAQSLLQSTGKDDEIGETAFILTSEYFPVTRRQMKQCWRFLRRPIREGAPVELDVEATVNQIGKEGILIDPVLVPRRVNRSQLLLLIDYGGSMVPFYPLSHRLVETAVRGGRLGKADIYYFHNCPVDYLYLEPNNPANRAISDILDEMRSDCAAILIFSDAGAARGGLSKERIELTKSLVNLLNKKVRYIAWLNPLSRQRWRGTTAEEIKELVPMFETTRRGLQNAIALLRGRTLVEVAGGNLEI